MNNAHPALPRLELRPDWRLPNGNTMVSLGETLSLLAAIDATGSLAAASQACKLSYRHAWGLLRQHETLLGAPLLISRRRQGTQLTPFAQRLLWANRRIEARLIPTLDSMAAELQEELAHFLPRQNAALRIHASHGFAVEALMQHMEDQPPVPELRYRTALEALAALEQGECDLAGFQIAVGQYQAPVLARYAQWLHPQRHVLIHLAVRSTGLIVAAGNPLDIQSAQDLARSDLRFVNRQMGSSTRHLVDLMLARLNIRPDQIRGYETSEFTHMAIAAHIASSMADAGIGVQTAAYRFGLDFIPLLQERYFFAVHQDALKTPAVRTVLETLRSPAFRQRLQPLVGYDGSRAGQVLTWAQAFDNVAT